MTIKQAADELRRMANARGGSTLLLWAADTMEELAKALAVAEYATGECEHCKHRATCDSCPDIDRMDFDCRKCDHPCRCGLCREGGNWEWRGVKEENGFE